MPKVTSREELRDWILRRLGAPVIDIELDEDQIIDRIEEALTFFQTFHFDGTEKTYLQHQISAADLTNKYIDVSPDVTGITKVFPSSASTSAINMWDIRYQMRLQDIQSFTTGSISNYWITMTHLRMLEMELQGEEPIRFNKVTNRLYIDWDWQKDVLENQYIIIEATIIVDPDTYNGIWDDRMLKLYAYALCKMQWGNNLKKYGSIRLPDGVVLNGKEIYEEAKEEKEALEKEFQDTYVTPSPFIVG